MLILIVDDEKLVRWSLSEKLTGWNYKSISAATGTEAYEKLSEFLPDIVLLDIKLPDIHGFEILKYVRAHYPDTRIIMITAESSIDTAVEAMRHGATDYLVKPFDFEKMHVSIENAIENLKLTRTVEELKAGRKKESSFAAIIGSSPQLMSVVETARKIAIQGSSTVLIEGESGTGKDLLAKAIHHASPRSEEPMIAISCASIPRDLVESEMFGHEKGAFTDAKQLKKGAFELASGGTLILDEIGEMPLELQPKLLRAIEERSIRRVGGVREIEVDIRIIAVTNADLKTLISEGQFRTDLYYRLKVIPLYLPSLRDRNEDALEVASHFVKMFNREFARNVLGLTDEAKKKLLGYHWPGNVRELRNIIERAMILGSHDLILPEQLAIEYAPPPQEHLSALEEVEMKILRDALQEAKGNQSEAARRLGISRDVLRYRCKKYDISGD